MTNLDTVSKHFDVNLKDIFEFSYMSEIKKY